MQDQYQQIKEIVDAAQHIVVIQADNPDADSLATSLALEQILHDLGKEPHLYCGIDMPEYLKYLSGWDRVSKDMPTNFDASIIVDTSAMSLLELLDKSDYRGWVAGKPCVVLDHHAGVTCDIPFATVAVNDAGKVSTGELVYDLAKNVGWQLSVAAKEFIATSILADSLGLVSENTTAQTYRVMAELVEGGVNRPKLEEQRRAFTKMAPVIFTYKGELIRRSEFHTDGSIALVTIPQNEINEYSPLYNPAPLIQNDHLQTEGVLVSVVLKSYDSGRITGAIRCNNQAPIGAQLAEYFGGGGHAMAAGFKIENAKPLDQVKSECIKVATDLLAALPKESHETTQHSF